ncbi:hypothetical protein [Leptothoe spongobia]|uniref:Uncharacterized protein n=1 Tax=Leptothoe spongobia TAU-MAC 1115 TaxID=1967444 RepID=A0A947GLZ5_9CYAN|nr:hypothetical protein [Leptothoe spongobia]MBT9317668.1 hypothetical protein [Leptothoe spongobia TAU-MAC 1115]
MRDVFWQIVVGSEALNSSQGLTTNPEPLTSFPDQNFPAYTATRNLYFEIVAIIF